MKWRGEFMRIETFWDDIDLYVIMYQNYADEVVMLDNIVIVPSEMGEKDIIIELKLKFKHIKEITQIDHFSEGLFLKRTIL